MIENKKYFWIKLNLNFMTSDAVDFLMGQKDGANYVVLYQMICLKTANTNGQLAKKIGDILVRYDAQKIQRDCKYFTLDTVVVAIELYRKLGLIFEQENGILRIAEFDKLVGAESDSAERVRRFRERKTQAIPLQCNDECNAECNAECNENVTQEIEIESKSKICLLNILKNKINRAGAYTRGMFDFEFELIENALKYGISLSKPETYAGKPRDSGFWSDVIEKMDDALLIKTVNALHNHHPDKDGIRYALGVLAGEFVKIKK